MNSQTAPLISATLHACRVFCTTSYILLHTHTGKQMFWIMLGHHPISVAPLRNTSNNSLLINAHAPFLLYACNRGLYCRVCFSALYVFGLRNSVASVHQEFASVFIKQWVHYHKTMLFLSTSYVHTCTSSKPTNHCCR